MLHLPLIEFFEQRPHRLVQLGQAKESAVAQPGQDPSLHYLYPNLNFGFVARFSHPCWDDRYPIILGHFLVSQVEIWVVPAGTLYSLFEIIWHQNLGCLLYTSDAADDLLC